MMRDPSTSKQASSLPSIGPYQLQANAELLLRHNYAEKAIRAIYGRNYFRSAAYVCGAGKARKRSSDDERASGISKRGYPVFESGEGCGASCCVELRHALRR